MNIKISKTEAEKQINDFFKDIKNKTPRLSRSGSPKDQAKKIKKIKRLAMNKKIPLKEKRKLFCKKCLNPYSGKEKVRIKEGKKSVECLNCGYISRWKIK